MADDNKKSGGNSGPPDPASPVIILFIIFAVFSALAVWVQRFIIKKETFLNIKENFSLFLRGGVSLSDLVEATGSSFLINSLFAYRIFAFVASIILIILVVWVARKLAIVDTKLRENLYPPEGYVAGAPSDEAKERINSKWQNVEKHINSENPSDWKLAILEADIMLDEMLDKMGYQGETMGEKLKQIEPSDFTTLDSAWEAHKIRNSIAHEGSDFLINKREADRVIGLYKEVFLEFKYI